MRQKIVQWIVLLSSLILLQTPLHAAQNTDRSIHRVLIFGDSISAAYNIPRDQGWVSLLQDFVKQQNVSLEIINASISGETTSGGLSRLKQQLELFKPNIVLLELGGNDGLRGFKLSETQQNLTQMVELIRAHGATVLLAGMQLPPNMGRTYTSRFIDIYTQLGKLDGVILMPLFLQEVASQPELIQADGIHPNADGQPLLMRQVWQFLQPLLLNKNATQ